MAWMVVRVRGTIHARHEIVETLRFLHLTRAEPCDRATGGALVPAGCSPASQGYITWGEADPETVGLLLHERGVTTSGAKVTEATLGSADPREGPPRAHAVRPHRWAPARPRAPSAVPPQGPEGRLALDQEAVRPRGRPRATAARRSTTSSAG